MFDWETSCQQFVLSRYKNNTVKYEIVSPPFTLSNEKRHYYVSVSRIIGLLYQLGNSRECDLVKLWVGPLDMRMLGNVKKSKITNYYLLYILLYIKI